MTIMGGSEDATPETPPEMHMRADGFDGVYRQDDAPPGAESHHPMNESHGVESAAEPAREVDQILASLSTTPKELGRLIEGQSDDALAQPASDGEWGVVEILPHLRDWEEVYLGWIHQLLDEDAPGLNDVDDSLWAIEHDYANEHAPDALAAFSELREEIVQLLESIDEASWQREAVHPQVGRITLHQLADRMCDHDARHIEQARDALA